MADEQEGTYFPDLNIKVSRRTAIVLQAYGAKSAKERRRMARSCFMEIAFMGVMRTMIRWLMTPAIPAKCKIREVALLPYKVTKFLTGRSEVVHLLEWRADG